ncbi:MAG: HD domain-containing protein [Bacteroidota bacterium]|nr:HD domain-containing protein [Candidatus Kapabacteria bacterium]MCS7301959.1 HD domain-containing protein [Candidatus Kapabacteria bacterium]MCX7936585.1 HD domain-containing protein [Chlorobiota bacterium]MDW8074778.1 HD domain-containing protein [Bacteroidota bacterium]MDW8271417.1 HD domain-containing protein [Bacteroidota bacterium]
MYHLTHLSISELEQKLRDKIDPVELNKVVSAYEMAESVHEGQVRRDGSPYFFHCSRVCKILIEELGITDTDVLCAALLHDVLEDSEEITRDIIAYNFGEYCAYIVETLTKDLERQEYDREAVEHEHLERLRHASDDCLIIRLAARLDNFRCLQFDLKRNPLCYIAETMEHYVPLAEERDNPHLHKLVAELRKEQNKFLG